MSWNLPLQIQRIQAEINEITLSGPVQNPMLAPLNANGNNISNVGILSGTTLNVANVNTTNFSTLGLFVNDLEVLADLKVDGGAIYGHDCYLNGELTVSQTSILSSNVTLGSALSVAGPSTFNNNVTMLGSLSVSGTINWNTFNPPIAESAGNTFLLLGSGVSKTDNNFAFTATTPQSGIQCLQYYGEGDAYAVYKSIGTADSMTVGLSKSPIRSYPPSGNFYSLVDYGVFIYPQEGLVYPVTNGVLGPSVAFTYIPSGTGTQTGIQISVVGTTMSIKLNGNTIAGLQQTIISGSYTLMAGGFSGGSLNGVIWGQVTNPTLAQVLNSGNNGNGNTINNVDINANRVYSSGYLEIGNSVGPGTSQLHLFYDTGDENGKNFQLVASQGGLQVQYYNGTTTPVDPLTIYQNSNIVLCDATNTNPTVQINGAQGLSRVYDTIYNPVSTNGNVDSSTFNFTLNYPTQQFPKCYTDQFISILEFSFPTNYNTFNLELSSFQFNYDYVTNVNKSINVLFFLSSANNTSGSGDQKNNITITNSNPQASNNPYNSPVSQTLTLHTTSPTNKIYLLCTNDFQLDPDMYIQFTQFLITVSAGLSNSNIITTTITVPT